MTDAPNVKLLPDDIMTEAIIFAGEDAAVHAKAWQEKNPAADTVPPVWLGKKELAGLDSLRIVSEGRYYARVYRAGKISEKQLHAIAVKLALAGVREARLYSAAYELLENWTPRLPGLKEDAIKGNNVISGLPAAGKEKRVHAVKSSLLQMAASEKARLLASRYEGIAIHPGSEAVFVYRSGIWEEVTVMELSREMVAIYNENRADFARRTITNVIEALKLVIPVMEDQLHSLIPFANGVYDLETGGFTPHQPENWITHHNGIEYTDPVPGENLHDHAPNFHKWLRQAADNDAIKMHRIAAALFMVLANRYDWQYFIEVTGDGGSGKSVFTHIATLLAGKHNTASGNMAALDEAGGRAQFVGKSLITLPDQQKYTGEGTGIKAITGGDALEINPKYERRYTTVVRAVVIATNNTPMIFTDRAGGVARRRVIFQFNNPVREDERDPDLSEKIAGEIPVVIRRLLEGFADPEKARKLLRDQRDSDEALEIKRATNPVMAFCEFLEFLLHEYGLMMGGGGGKKNPRQYLYPAYLAYMEYQGLGRPLSVNEFAKALKEAARTHGSEYRTRKVKGVTQTNVKLTEKADEFL